MQNNWWSSQKSKGQAPNLIVKQSEVIWNQRREEVFAEITKLLDLESADTNTPGWFEMHLKAIWNIHDHMTDKEQLELEAEVARLTEEGYLEDQK